MAKALTSTIQTQIDNKKVKFNYTFTINGTDYSDYVINWNLSNDKKFGSASATFTLNNSSGIFGSGGLSEINVGDVVQVIELYGGDATQFKKFYGVVEQRSLEKTAQSRTIVINCLDYISILQHWDISYEAEGTKVQVEEETLLPNYLPSPNDSLAQVFDFKNNQIALDPKPTLTIRPKEGTELVGESPQFDGFSIRNAEGQVLLGTPLNVLDNYDLIAVSYYFYTQGIFVEDVLEGILTQVDGYGHYLFGEASAQAVIDNHLKDTFLNVEGRLIDTLIPNDVSSSVIIKHQLSQAYDPDNSGDNTTLYLDSTEGFPTSGSGTINGDAFTWTGKTSTTLTGVPLSGSDSLSAKPTASYVKYSGTYEAGRVWYLTYSNITSTLLSGEFDGLSSGITIDYIDYRNGRIILSSAMSIASTITHTGDYTFKTLQATGIELNRIKFKPRELSNRFEAINKLREYIAPNYVIRTIGDNKIWSSYLTQKTVPDYTLSLIEKLDYLEDEDLYTRVVFYGKNNNPTNIMLRTGVDFVTTGENYRATATQTELQFEKEEDNYWVYKTTITDAGVIDSSVLKPLIYLNNVPVNDKAQPISLMPVSIKVTTRIETITTQKRKSTNVTVNQYFYYKVLFAHTSIDPTQSIYLYDSVGTLLKTIAPNDTDMDYGNGVYNVPGTEQNSTVEQISTASYTVFYSTSGIIIDFNTVRFKISKQLVINKDFTLVTATFQYFTAIIPFSNIKNVIDGRLDTQVQTEFYAEPPTGLGYAILDLGQTYNVQAIDFIGGLYRPDNIRKFDVNFKFSLYYSLDNITYNLVSAETSSIEMTGGRAITLEEDKLGTDFEARYLKIALEDVSKINFNYTGTPTTNVNIGVWVVAFTEIAAYDDLVLKSEAKLISTTELTTAIDVESLSSSGGYPTTIDVLDTTGFEEPSSGEYSTAYVEEDFFMYTGLTSTSFTGVTGLGSDHEIGARVSQELSGDTTRYDSEYLLPNLGDRLYKEIKINNDVLYTQSQLDTISLAYLNEFYKNHTKIKVSVLYAPHLQVGQTVAITDSFNNVVSENYFIESINDNGGKLDVVLARFPD